MTCLIHSILWETLRVLESALDSFPTQYHRQIRMGMWVVRYSWSPRSSTDPCESRAGRIDWPMSPMP